MFVLFYFIFAAEIVVGELESVTCFIALTEETPSTHSSHFHPPPVHFQSVDMAQEPDNSYSVETLKVCECRRNKQ